MSTHSTSSSEETSFVPFRFLSTGVGERAMEVRQIGNGSVTVVDPAPAQF